MPAHRILAVNRGEREEVLRVRIEVDEEPILERLEKWFPHRPHLLLQEVAADSYKRLIAPSIEREIRASMTEKAEEQAIHIFAENLRKLLLQPPVRGKTVLGLDPAYRTGCKLAVVDDTGKVHHIDLIYPTPPQNRIAEAKQVVRKLIEAYQIDLIAIGNGTASRESEQFIADLIGELDRDVYYVIVNEAGASVYSASKLAGRSFLILMRPSEVPFRSPGACRILSQSWLRLTPRPLGLANTSTMFSQKQLAESLTAVVESAVNHVGVDVNTASPSLLQYVSGVTASVAKNIVKRREELGRFRQRKELAEVPRLGAKTFEQCVGFLRIVDGDNPLDKTPIHPESYPVVEQLLTLLDAPPEEIGTEALNKRLREVDVPGVAKQLACGEPTLRDIIDALLRPGRDPREELPAPIFRSDVLQLEDLQEGMELKGTVRNVVDFGAFVDIGLKNDGLVHISKMSERFVRHPMDVVSVGDVVDVWVLAVDPERERVSLSMLPAK